MSDCDQLFDRVGKLRVAGRPLAGRQLHELEPDSLAKLARGRQGGEDMVAARVFAKAKLAVLAFQQCPAPQWVARQHGAPVATDLEKALVDHKPSSDTCQILSLRAQDARKPPAVKTTSALEDATSWRPARTWKHFLWHWWARHLALSDLILLVVLF
mmetsp:Transcript_85654/g.275467  ORF Transcript_85654/g.275467 Transcript_85654/m.275467 type:complete len:157 (-) Transcript_85654:5-475(-)